MPAPTRPPTQPDSSSEQARNGSLIAASAAAAAVGPAAVGATRIGAGAALGAAALLPGAAAASAAVIEQALETFYSRRYAAYVTGLPRKLARAYPKASPALVQSTVDEELAFERSFEAKQRARWQRDIPPILALPPDEREKRMRKLMARERQIAEMRERALLGRAGSRLEHAAAKLASPEGAYWTLDPRLKTHTLDCVAMAGKFWPWSVIDRVRPPRHANCGCRLWTLDHAVAQGWMTRDQVPDEADAIRRANDLARRVPELRDAFLREGVSEDAAVAVVLEADRWLDLAEARHRDTHPGTDHGRVDPLRYPKGFKKGGQFRPRHAYDPGLPTAMRKSLRHLHRPSARVGRRRGEWRTVDGHRVFVPEREEWRRTLGGTRYVSPPQSTNVYPAAKTAESPGVGDHLRAAAEKVRDELKQRDLAEMRARDSRGEAPVQTGDNRSRLHLLGELGYRRTTVAPGPPRLESFRRDRDGRTLTVELGRSEVKEAEANAGTPAPSRSLDRAPQNWEEFRSDVLGYAADLAERHKATNGATDFTTDPRLGDIAGQRTWDGVTAVGEEDREVLERTFVLRRRGDLSDADAAEAYIATQVPIHEISHAVNPEDERGFQDPARQWLDEALVEELSRQETAERLRRQGQTDVLSWMARNPDHAYLNGNYSTPRMQLAAALDRAGVAPEDRRAYLERLKYEIRPDERIPTLARDAAAHNGTQEEAERQSIEGLLRDPGHTGPAGWYALPTLPQPAADLAEHAASIEVRGRRVGPGSYVTYGDRDGRVTGLWADGDGTYSLAFDDRGATTYVRGVRPGTGAEGLGIEDEGTAGGAAEGDLVTWTRPDGKTTDGRVERLLAPGERDWALEATTSDGQRVVVTDRSVRRLEVHGPDGGDKAVVNGEEGRHLFVEGKGWHFVPEGREWRLEREGHLYTSPEGTTDVYRDGELVSTKGKRPSVPELTPPSKRGKRPTRRTKEPPTTRTETPAGGPGAATLPEATPEALRSHSGQAIRDALMGRGWAYRGLDDRTQGQEIGKAPPGTYAQVFVSPEGDRQIEVHWWPSDSIYEDSPRDVTEEPVGEADPVAARVARNALSSTEPEKWLESKGFVGQTRSGDWMTWTNPDLRASVLLRGNPDDPAGKPLAALAVPARGQDARDADTVLWRLRPETRVKYEADMQEVVKRLTGDRANGWRLGSAKYRDPVTGKVMVQPAAPLGRSAPPAFEANGPDDPTPGTRKDGLPGFDGYQDFTRRVGSGDDAYDLTFRVRWTEEGGLSPAEMEEYRRLRRLPYGKDARERTPDEEARWDALTDRALASQRSRKVMDAGYADLGGYSPQDSFITSGTISRDDYVKRAEAVTRQATKRRQDQELARITRMTDRIKAGEPPLQAGDVFTQADLDRIGSVSSSRRNRGAGTATSTIRLRDTGGMERFQYTNAGGGIFGGGETRWKVVKVTAHDKGAIGLGRQRLGRTPHTDEELRRDALGRADEMGDHYGATVKATNVDFGGTGRGAAGVHRWDGSIGIDVRSRNAIREVMKADAEGRELSDGEKADFYDAMETLQHEVNHGVNPHSMSEYKGLGIALEEGLTEETAHVLLDGWLHSMGRDDVREWARDHPGHRYVQGTYQGYREFIRAALDRAGVPPERRGPLLEHMKFGQDNSHRVATLAELIARNRKDRKPEPIPASGKVDLDASVYRAVGALEMPWGETLEPTYEGQAVAKELRRQMNPSKSLSALGTTWDTSFTPVLRVDRPDLGDRPAPIGEGRDGDPIRPGDVIARTTDVSNPAWLDAPDAPMTEPALVIGQASHGYGGMSLKYFGTESHGPDNAEFLTGDAVVDLLKPHPAGAGEEVRYGDRVTIPASKAIRRDANYDFTDQRLSGRVVGYSADGERALVQGVARPPSWDTVNERPTGGRAAHFEELVPLKDVLVQFEAPAGYVRLGDGHWVQAGTPVVWAAANVGPSGDTAYLPTRAWGYDENGKVLIGDGDGVIERMKRSGAVDASELGLGSAATLKAPLSPGRPFALYLRDRDEYRATPGFEASGLTQDDYVNRTPAYRAWLDDPATQAAFEAARDREREWTASVEHALSVGTITPEQAQARGYRIDEGRPWIDLPPRLYHATHSLGAIRSAGELRSRRDLGMDRAGGLGGGDDDTVSFTTDPALARTIAQAFLEARDVVNGDVSATDLLRRADSGDRGSEPFLDVLVQNQWGSPRGIDAPESFVPAVREWLARGAPRGTTGDDSGVPRGLLDLVNGRVRVVHIASPWTRERWEAEGLTPDPASRWTHGSPDAPEMWTEATRPMTDPEWRDARMGLYKSFSFIRGYKGGPEDPLFFGTDPEAIAAIDPADVGVVTAEPAPGARGIRLEGMGEIRTKAPEATRLVDFETVSHSELEPALARSPGRPSGGFARDLRLPPEPLPADVYPGGVATGTYVTHASGLPQDDPTTRLVLALKAADGPSAPADAAQRLSAAAEAQGWHPDVVVSPPADPGRPDRLARVRRAVAADLGAEAADPLRQARDVPGYRGMSARRRREATAALGGPRFEATDPGKVRGRDVLLIDDVVTSGEQAKQARDALLAAGARDVHFAAVARADSLADEVLPTAPGAAPDGEATAHSPGRPGAEVPPLRPEFLERVRRNLADDANLPADKFAGDHDMTDGEYDAAAEARLRELADGADLVVRLNPVDLPRFLDGGHLMNQHEAGTSHGSYDPQWRASMESGAWNIPGAPERAGGTFGRLGPASDYAAKYPDLFPVYGYLSDPALDPAGVQSYEHPQGQYGRAKIVLRPEVKARAYTYFSDSLGDVSDGVGAPSPVAAPSVLSVPRGDPLTWTTVGPVDFSSTATRGPNPYAEAQIFGGVRPADVLRIELADPPMQQQREALEKAGVPWSIESTYADLRQHILDGLENGEDPETAYFEIDDSVTDEQRAELEQMIDDWKRGHAPASAEERRAAFNDASDAMAAMRSVGAPYSEAVDELGNHAITDAEREALLRDYPGAEDHVAMSPGRPVPRIDRHGVETDWWEPGNWGRGFVLRDGTVMLWNEDEGQHAEFLSSMGREPDEEMARFSIAPDGTVDLEPHETADPDLKAASEVLAQKAPGLRQVGMLEYDGPEARAESPGRPGGGRPALEGEALKRALGEPDTSQPVDAYTVGMGGAALNAYLLNGRDRKTWDALADPEDVGDYATNPDLLNLELRERARPLPADAVVWRGSSEGSPYDSPAYVSTAVDRRWAEAYTPDGSEPERIVVPAGTPAIWTGGESELLFPPRALKAPTAQSPGRPRKDGPDKTARSPGRPGPMPGTPEVPESGQPFHAMMWHGLADAADEGAVRAGIDVTRGDGEYGQGFYATSSSSEARGFGERVVPVEVTLRKAATERDWDAAYSELAGRYETPDGMFVDSPEGRAWETDAGAMVRAELVRRGFDGLVTRRGENVWAVALTNEGAIARSPGRPTGWREVDPVPGHDVGVRNDFGSPGTPFAPSETWDRMRTGRDTGHFGSGLYFVSGEGDSLRGVEGNTRGVDLAGARLFRPRDNKHAYAVHDALGDVNTLASRKAPDGLEGDGSVFGPKPIRPSTLAITLPVADNSLVPPGEGDLFDRKARVISQAVRDTVADEAAADAAGRPADFDSASTRVMRAFGWDGVDTRHLRDDADGLSGLDNTMYGSVLYSPPWHGLPTAQSPGRPTRDRPSPSIDRVADAFHRLDPYESIAAAECHDAALGSFEWAVRHGMTDPRIHSAGSHTFVTAGYRGQRVVIDPVAEPQHLGRAFKPLREADKPIYHQKGQRTFRSIEAYWNDPEAGRRINLEGPPEQAAAQFADELDAQTGDLFRNVARSPGRPGDAPEADRQTVETPSGDRIELASIDGQPNVLDEDGDPTPAEDWLWDLSDGEVSRLLGYPEDEFSPEFWRRPAPLFHATTTENAEAIRTEGIGARDRSRAPSNRGTGPAVFTTTEPEALQGSYGDALFRIDTAAMARDGFTPRVGREEPIVASENRESLARLVGLDDFYDDSLYGEGLDPSTVVIYGEVPAKYLHPGEVLPEVMRSPGRPDPSTPRPGVAFHLAPASARDSIRERGLQPSGETMMGAPDGAAPRVYLHPDAHSVMEHRGWATGEPMDVWRVDTDGLDVRSDRPGAFPHTEAAVPPERLTLALPAEERPSWRFDRNELYPQSPGRPGKKGKKERRRERDAERGALGLLRWRDTDDAQFEADRAALERLVGHRIAQSPGRPNSGDVPLTDNEARVLAALDAKIDGPEARQTPTGRYLPSGNVASGLSALTGPERRAVSSSLKSLERKGVLTSDGQGGYARTAARPPDKLEGLREAGAAEFAAALSDAYASTRRGRWLTPHTEAELAGARTFLANDGHTGGALIPTADGHLEAASLFNRRDLGAPAGGGAEMLRHLTAEGADYLSATGDDLRALYESLGWEVTQRIEWSDEYAPEGWDYARDGRPPIYEMRPKRA